MISGISGSNSIYNYQSTINQYRLAQALKNNYSNESLSTAETPKKKAANAFNSSVSYIKSYNASMTDLMDSANSLRKVNSSSVMNELSVSSSDTDVLTADQRFRVKSPQDFDINVSQVAASQVNVTNPVDSSVLAEDMSFTISAGTGMSGDFTVSSLKEDGTQKTNRQILSDAAKATNDISLDNGKISISLKKEGAASVKAAVDSGKVISAMESFVSSYNQAKTLLNDNVGRGSGTVRQLDRLESVLGSRQDQETLGLSVKKDGKLTLDKDKLQASLKDKPDLTKDLISGSFGIAQRAFSSSASSLTTPVSSLIGNDIAEIEYENAISPTNYMNAFSKTGANNLTNFYSIGLLFNMTV